MEISRETFARLQGFRREKGRAVPVLQARETGQRRGIEVTPGRLPVAFDLDDTLWAIEPVLVRAEGLLYDWLRQHAPAVAATGVDQIAVGWLTHSAKVLDIGLDA